MQLFSRSQTNLVKANLYDFDVLVTGPSGENCNAEFEVNGRMDKGFTGFCSPICALAHLFPCMVVQENGDGIFQGSWVPEQPGDFTVAITFKGEEIKGRNVVFLFSQQAEQVGCYLSTVVG